MCELGTHVVFKSPPLESTAGLALFYDGPSPRGTHTSTNVINFFSLTSFFFFLTFDAILFNHKEVQGEYNIEITDRTRWVLVVEDDAPTLALFDMILKGEGYGVILANNGDDGIEKFRQQRFDVVVTDMDLPTISGADVFYKLRYLKPDMRVIVASGRAESHLITKMKSDGLYSFLAKPFNPKELVNTVRQAIEY